MNQEEISATIRVQVNSNDSISSIAKVEIYLDQELIFTDTEFPYYYDWDTRQVGNGPHTLTIIAYDQAGNNNSNTLSVIVNNNQSQQAFNVAIISLVSSIFSFTGAVVARRKDRSKLSKLSTIGTIIGSCVFIFSMASYFNVIDLNYLFPIVALLTFASIVYLYFDYKRKKTSNDTEKLAPIPLSKKPAPMVELTYYCTICKNYFKYSEFTPILCPKCQKPLSLTYYCPKCERRFIVSKPNKYNCPICKYTQLIP